MVTFDWYLRSIVRVGWINHVSAYVSVRWFDGRAMDGGKSREDFTEESEVESNGRMSSLREDASFGIHRRLLMSARLRALASRINFNVAERIAR